MIDSMKSAKDKAAEALRAVLRQVSQIKVKDVEFDSPRPDLKVDILAHLDVQGHSHTLMCTVDATGQPDHVRMALDKFRDHSTRLADNSTMVFIAPHLPEESQTLCREGKAGFLDLEGNARLDFGDVFIGKRSLPQVGNRSKSPAIERGAQQLQGIA